MIQFYLKYSNGLINHKENAGTEPSRNTSSLIFIGMIFSVSGISKIQNDNAPIDAKSVSSHHKIKIKYGVCFEFICFYIRSKTIALHYYISLYVCAKTRDHC